MSTCCRRPGVLVLIAALWPIAASALDVTVLDRRGKPVPDVVVFSAPSATMSPTPVDAVMDQVDRRFDPHILVVPKGSLVSFPNSDIVAHHVYSFSRPNQFTLPLYKGEALDPVRFEHAGVVTIGCNIHDDMLAYIVVVDSAAYAMTDGDGRATLAHEDWDFPTEITLWSPRFRGAKKGYLTKTIADADALEVRLEKSLRPVHRQSSWSSGEDDY